VDPYNFLLSYQYSVYCSKVLILCIFDITPYVCIKRTCEFTVSFYHRLELGTILAKGELTLIGAPKYVVSLFLPQLKSIQTISLVY
jgi:hypothetical protein